MTIDQATGIQDADVNGDEFLPASEGGLPRKVSTAQIAAYTLQLLRDSSEADFSTSGSVTWKNASGALKFASGVQFANTIIAYAFARSGVSNLTSSDKFVVRQGDEQLTLTLGQLSAYLGAQITATIELNGMASADALSGSELLLVEQSTNKQVSLSSVREFVLGGLSAYIYENATTASAPDDTEYVFSHNGTTLRKWTLGSMKAFLADVHGPASTTEGNVPQWDTAQKTLKNGLSVSQDISGGASHSQLPTAKAAKDYTDSRISSILPNSAVTGSIPTFRDASGALSGGKSVSTSIAIAASASDDKIPTEKAVRSAVDAERSYVDDEVKIEVADHSAGNLAVFGSDGLSLDAGPSVTDEVRSSGAADTRVPTELAVRAAIDGAMEQGIAGKEAATQIRPTAFATDDRVPTEHAVAAALDSAVTAGIHSDGEVPLFDGAGGQLKGGTALVTDVRSASNSSNDAIPTEKAVRTAVDTVRTALDNKKLDELATPSSGTSLDATTTRHGLMSASDKNKLDNLIDSTTADEMGGNLDDADTLLVHDASRNSPRKSLLSRVWTYISSKLLSFPLDSLSPASDSTDCDSTTEHHGLLPKLLETPAGKFLRADGQWTQPPGSTVFDGATSEAAGTAGIVPAPALGETAKFLKSNGEWADLPFSAGDVDFDNISDAPSIDDDAKVLTFDGTNYYLLKLGDFLHRWDTIWVPAGAMTPDSTNPAAADSVLSAGNGTIRDALRFSTQDRFCHFNLVLPDDFDPGSGIKVKVYWTTTAEAVSNTWTRFTLQGLFSRLGDELSVSLGSITNIDDIVLSASSQKVQISPAASISPAGTYGKGSMLHFRLGRSYTNFSPANSTRNSENVYVLGVLFRFCRKADGLANLSQQEAW